MAFRKECRLHKIGGSTKITVPPNIVRALQLKHGDVALWESDENGTATIKFFKVTTSMTPAMTVTERTNTPEEEPEAEAAA